MSPATAAQRDLLERLREVLTADERVESAWLSGSFGRGAGDAWSDIDVLAVVDEEDLPHCVSEYAGARNPVGETVILNNLFNRLASAVTPHWERYDIFFVTPKEFRGYDKAALRPLTLASLDIPPAEAKPPKPYQPSRDALAATVQEFFRIQGLAPVGIERGEWLSVQEGVGLLRKALIDLMIESNGIGRADRGGAKRLNPYLTADQRAAMEAIPFPGPSREDAIAANEALAALFIPLARDLTQRVGGVWPGALEAATRRHLAEKLNLTI